MNKKSILVVLSVLALVAASVFGTLAYLTDTDQATNTFTVGRVGITLDEQDVDDTDKDGNTTERDTTNKYHLLPGHTYVKDPTVHVDADSEDCYLFVTVANGIKAIETTVEADTIAAQMAAKGWMAVDGYENLYIYTEGGSKHIVTAGESVVVFDKFTVDGATVDNAKLAQYAEEEIVVNAYAVQAAGFENSTPAAIWAAAAFN